MSHFEKVWFIGMLFHCCKLVSQDNFFGAGYFLSLLKSMQFWAQITMKLQIPSSNTVTKSCWKRNNMNAILRVSQLAMDSWIYSVKAYFSWYEACNLWFHSSNTKFVLGFLICSTFQQVGGYTVTSIILTPFMNGSSIHDSIRWNLKKKTGGQNNTFKEARIPYLLNLNAMLF